MEPRPGNVPSFSVEKGNRCSIHGMFRKLQEHITLFLLLKKIFTYLAASGPSCGACGILVWWVGFSLAEAHGLSSCGTRA